MQTEGGAGSMVMPLSISAAGPFREASVREVVMETCLLPPQKWDGTFRFFFFFDQANLEDEISASEQYL